MGPDQIKNLNLSAGRQKLKMKNDSSTPSLRPKGNLQLKITKSFRKIFRLSFLLSAREFYFFLANLYGLVCHPLLTIRKIQRDRDLSQGLLIFGLPVYFWLGTIVLLAITRVLVGIRGNFGWVAQASFFLITFTSGLFFLYLYYWFCKSSRKFGGGNK